MSLPKYPKYKDSGVEWLGEVPEGWETSKIKHVAKMFGRIGYRGYTTDDLVEEGCGAITLSPSNMINGGLNFEHCTYISWNKYEESPEIKISAHNILLVKTGSTYGKVSFVERLDHKSTINPQLAVIKDFLGSSKYLFWTLSAKFFQGLFDISNTGSTIPTMTQASVINWLFPYPPLPEQTAIASFLDRETGKIDALVSEQERLIALLKEKRQALISHAVTKGLDPKAQMKPSGVAWLGDVPQGWVSIPLKRVASLKSGDSITSEMIKEEGECPVYGGNGIRGYFDSYTHEGYYPLIGRQGALCGNVNFATGKFWASEHAVVVNPKLPVVIKWLGEVLRAMNLNQYSTSAAQPGLSVEVISNLFIPFPPLPEQAAIADFLDRETSKIDALMKEAERGIELLKERRSALISAAVTGKIDVRGLE